MHLISKQAKAKYCASANKRPFTVTIFGAESTGKTTLSRQLAAHLNAHWVYEFARPYLEQFTADITTDSMTAIWRGQMVAQSQALVYPNCFIVMQDTDLFSTEGYWQLPHVKKVLGKCPNELIADAKQYTSNLYIVTPSNIPFERDPLRYGGTKRESNDEYWIELCVRHKLPFVVLSTCSAKDRLDEAVVIIKSKMKEYLCAE